MKNDKLWFHWMSTATGRRVYPLTIKPDDIDIVDIAHALSNICRYGGHTRTFYSVAQHSVMASEIVDDMRWGLLHDAAEAYIGDIICPIKKQLDQIYVIEEVILEAIAERFDLCWPPPKDEIEFADSVLIATERRDLMDPNLDWGEWLTEAPLPEMIVPWSPLKAKKEFLIQAEKLEVFRRHSGVEVALPPSASGSSM